ncbi:hypothetical protein [Streptomyces sp. NBC_00582]|uniref:hypothetical protein n=1 Tax=Streptomyces sp. NBC_00582 TaxID=2975783 RepID=UPI002E81A02A|nr:hypothetical protein [Streptomyces sp. NBC_00582]WUB61549.1 hypothetical protein OG852_14675 [Streptomyces sp. NBC_00582]
MDATSGRHVSTVQACRGFSYKHLTDPRLQQVSRLFHDVAVELLTLLPDDPELTAALRKLREAKDCAVLLAAVAPAPEGR